MDSAGGWFYGCAMTIPPDPQRQGQPPVSGPPPGPGYGSEPPYPGQYGGQQYPGQQSPPGPYPEPGQHGRSYGEQESVAYPYDPYARQYHPAGLGYADQHTRRPAAMVLALVLLILSALPYLAIGVIALIGAGFVRENLPPEQSAQFAAAGLDPVTLVAVVGVGFVVIALGYVVLAVFAFQGKNWARIVTTLMTVVFVGLGGFSVVLGGTQGAVLDPSTFLVLFGPALLALIGTILFFVPGSTRYFASSRR